MGCASRAQSRLTLAYLLIADVDHEHGCAKVTRCLSQADDIGWAVSDMKAPVLVSPSPPFGYHCKIGHGEPASELSMNFMTKNYDREVEILGRPLFLPLVAEASCLI